MDWIRVDANTPRHFKVGRLARRLGVGRVQAFGHVVTLWCWAIENAAHGSLSELEPEEIAEAAAWDDDPSVFVSALESAGLMTPERTLHDWVEYQGKSSRVTAQGAVRQERKRLRDAAEKSRHARVTHDRDRTVTRDERDERDERDVEELSSADADPLAPSLADAVALWNQTAAGTELPQCRAGKDDARKWKARTANQDFVAGYPEAIRRLCRSSFARSGKWASFRWLLANDTNWRKAAEGNYDDGPCGNKPKPSDPGIRGAHTPSAPPLTDEQREEAARDAERLAEMAERNGRERDAEGYRKTAAAWRRKETA